MRELKCSTCGEMWEEPVRPGARPLECPQCNPAAAAQRDAKRARRREANAEPVLVEVQPYLRSVVESSVTIAASVPSTGRVELARQVRRVAQAQGRDAELREELNRLAALCHTWAAWLPEPAIMEEVHAA